MRVRQRDADCEAEGRGFSLISYGHPRFGLPGLNGEIVQEMLV